MDKMEILTALLVGIWIFIPAYAANLAAPLPKGEKRMDFGKKLGKKDLLGAGKTWEGFLFAVLLGTLAGVIQVSGYEFLNGYALQAGFSLPQLSYTAVFFIALGSMCGDVVASFFKRRVGFERGKSVILLDQLDFILGGLVAAYFFLTLQPLPLFLVLVITPVLHYGFNLLGYELGYKEVPW
ncbi:MAG: CDP-2,3-bis-(O-geranylgeranyl)-sn-glycerol synthase [Candidatus Aenigmatarchaeota archaeon]